MITKTSKRLRYGLIAWCAILPVACSDPPPANGGRGTEQLTIGITADIRGTNPGVDRDGNTDSVLLHVVEGLVAYREDMTIGPMLAESYELSDDGRTYSFKLRPDVTFHNGAPLTSREVKWSWDRMLDPGTGWLCRGWYDGTDDAKITTIDTTDDHTVRFTLDQPSAIFLARLASFQCLAAVLHPDSVDAAGKWRQPVGTGPYMFDGWQPGHSIDLVRFDAYQARPGPRDGLTGGKVAHARRLKWLVIPDPASMKAALLAGQLDVLPQILSRDMAELERSPNVAIYKSPGLERSSLLIQTNDSLLKDVRIRRAIAHAIDARAVVNVTELGMAAVNPSVIPMSDPYHSQEHARGHTFDPAMARRLLEEAGYKGQRIKLKTNARYQSMYDNAVVIQSMLKLAGFDVELEVVDWATLISQYLTGEFQLVSFGFSGRTDPALGYMTILGDKAAEPYLLWDDPEAIDALRRASRISDAAERQTLFDHIHEMMLRDTPVVELYNPQSIDAAARQVKGYDTWPAVKPRLWGVWKAQ